MDRNPARLVAEQQRMTSEDKATGSDSLSIKKTLIEGAKAPALHSILLMCNRYICSIDEELSETDGSDQGPSIIVLNKLAEARNLHRVRNQSALELTNSQKESANLKGNVEQSG